VEAAAAVVVEEAAAEAGVEVEEAAAAAGTFSSRA